MKQNHALVCLVVLAILHASAVHAVTMERATIASFGGNSSNAQVTVSLVVGIPSEVPSSNSSYSLFAGFWYPGDVSTGVGGQPVVVPRKTRLYPNFPNPFNPLTTIPFDVGTTSHPTLSKVILNIYDVKGQLVTTLVDEQLQPGRYRAIWDGRNAAGGSVSSGVYFSKLIVGSSTRVGRLVLIK